MKFDIIKYILSSIIFISLAAWTGQGLLCYHRLWGWCGREHYITVAGLIALLVLAPIGLSYKQRALRRASRGMWSRSWHRGTGHELTATFTRVTRLVIGQEEEAPAGSGNAYGPHASIITGTDRYERRGWWIDLPLDGGTRIWVDRWELWRWLIEVEGLRYQLKSGESPIGRGYWEPKIGRPRWMAYMIILEEVGAAETVTGDPRSRRYVGGDAWGLVEQFEKIRASEARR